MAFIHVRAISMGTDEAAQRHVAQLRAASKIVISHNHLKYPIAIYSSYNDALQKSNKKMPPNKSRAF